MQTLALRARSSADTMIENARCTLSNDHGNWHATAPGSVVVRRSATPLHVECRKNGMKEGVLRAQAHARVDGSFHYPESLDVRMGETLIAPLEISGSNRERAATR